MKQIWLGALLALSVLSGTARAQVAVEIGGRSVAVTTPAGVEPLSIAAPDIIEVYRAGMPPTHRLAEAFLSEADIARVRSGALADDVIYQMQVGSAFTDTEISPGDWLELRPALAREIGGLDLAALASDTAKGMNERLTDALGADVRIEFGAIGRPQVYGDRTDSVRFHTLLPVTAAVAGQQASQELQAAAAALPLNGRLVFLYALRRHRAGEDARVVHAALDRWVDAMIAANPR